MHAVIHEMRNHLALAVANIEAFRDGTFEPSQARLTSVLQALCEVDMLCSDLPLNSRPAELQSVPCSIDACSVIANEVLAFEALASQRGVAFFVERCDHKYVACEAFDGDAMRIAEIVNNVLLNAIRYTPSGGRIDVDCRQSEEALMLVVTDGGPGVRLDERTDIFEPGFRGSVASKWSGGTGYGLSLTKRFVGALGGTIVVGNAFKRGARFSVRLPGKKRDRDLTAQLALR